MDIKKVKISVRTSGASQRVVYGSDGNIIVGDEEAVQNLVCRKSKLTIAVKGQQGETLKAVIHGLAYSVSGDIEAVVDALEGFPNERIATVVSTLANPHEHSDTIYEHSEVVSSAPVPLPLPGVAPFEDEAEEGTGAVSEGDSDRDSGGNEE